MYRADEPRALSGDDADLGAVLCSDMLAMMASAGARLREVTAPTAAVEEPEAPPAAATPSRPAGTPPALSFLARGRDGVLVAPGWGRRAPPPIR